MSPSNSTEDDSFKSFLQKNNKFSFKKDSFEFNMAQPFELLAETRKRHWQAFRTGYVSIGMASSITHKNENGIDKIVFVNPVAKLKTLKLFEKDTESDTPKLKKDFSNAAGAIFGIMNIVFTQIVPKEIEYFSPMYFIPNLDPSHFVFNL